jgi:hypothetical protein
MQSSSLGISLKVKDWRAGIRASQLALQQKLFAHPDNNKVIEAVYRAALDDDHKHQAAAQKLLMDRMLPIPVCDKNTDIKEKITININSVEIPEREEKVVN